MATVKFVDHLRDMVKFNSVEELLGAMAADVAKARELGLTILDEAGFQRLLETGEA